MDNAGTEIPDMQPITAVRKRIQSILASGGSPAVRALLALRRKETRARPNDGLNRLFICLLFGIAIPSIARSVIAILIGLVVALCFYAVMQFKYPHRDRVDQLEKSQIDAMVKMAIEQLSQSNSFDDLSLDREEKRELLKLYGHEDMPRGVREAICRPERALDLPDV